MKYYVVLALVGVLSLGIAFGQTTATQSLSVKVKGQSLVNISSDSVTVGASDSDVVKITTGGAAVTAPASLVLTGSGGTLTYFTNLANGIKVGAALTGGNLATAGVTVKLTYDGSDTTLSATNQDFLTLTANGSDTTGKAVSLSFTAPNTVAAGTYTDTITYTLTANP